MAGYSAAEIDRLLAQGRAAEAVARTEAAAAAGDAAAGYRLATWLLIGSPIPRDLPRARTFLRRAAESGSILAGLMEVALAANGTGASPDWGGALALLRELARTDPVAARNIDLLERMDIDEDGQPPALAEPDVLSTSPYVRRWPSLFTAEECAHVARAAQPMLQPAMTVHPQTGRTVAHPFRTSHSTALGPTYEDLPIQAMLRRIAAATGTEVAQGEPLTVLRYAPGQQYRSHLDLLPPGGNQRILTALLYLNEGYAGGETRFDATGLTVAGRTGDLLVFANVRADGSPDPRSQHAGMPVRQGVKWLATRWIRERPFSPWAPY